MKTKSIFDPPYPSDAWTPKVKAAIDHAYKTVQCPYPMAAASHLAVVSAVCQGLVDMRYLNGQKLPISLFLLTEGESGEGKTSVDKMAQKALRLFQQRQDELRPLQDADYEASMAVWGSKKSALRKEISKAFTNGEDLGRLEAQMAELLAEQPVRDRSVRLLINDATSQALIAELMSWPYAAVHDDDAGDFLSSGMSLAQLNKLWEAGELRVSRISRGSFVLSGARLTIFLQVQKEVLNEFLDGKGKLAIANRNLGRFLSAFPGSTLGMRDRRAAPPDVDESVPFHERVAELLQHFEGGSIPDRETLEFSEEAKRVLAQFAKDIDEALLPHGWFVDMRGHATKMPENAGRLASCLHFFEGMTGPISVDLIRRTIKLAAYHLNQFKLRFCPLHESEQDILDLTNFFDKNVSSGRLGRLVDMPTLLRYGPKHLRKKDHMLLVLRGLCLEGKVRVHHQPRLLVELDHWFPPPVQQHAQIPGSFNTVPAFVNNHGRSFRKDEITPVEVPIERDGYMLWPGVYLT